MDNFFILLVLILPLLNFLIILFLGRYLGSIGSCYFANINMLIGFLIILLYFLTKSINDFFIIRLGSWVIIGDLEIYWDFYIDNLTLILFFIVTLISTLVHLYSVTYMIEDKYQTTFISYLSLFTFFMLILISSGNFFQLFLGWEGVGLCSFLLISFWSDRIYAVNSAIKAIILNRLGDIGLLIVIVLVYLETSSLDFIILFNITENEPNILYNIFNFDINFFFLLSISLLIAAVGKSAQYLLHGWLPDAMEGPTPVSALIHAATMVTAGIFLLIRCSFIFINTPKVLFFVIILGFLTVLFGSFTGLKVYDLKKIIAFSTTSHLGYMFMSCGLMLYNTALYHLVVHACFKALLFLTAGSIIHSFDNEQDIRKMSGLSIYMPVTQNALLLGILSMNGFFNISGILSKDLIIVCMLFGNTIYSFFIFCILFLSIFFSSFYSFRMLFIILKKSFNNNTLLLKKIYELNFFLIIPLILLCFLSIYIGFSFELLFKEEYFFVYSKIISKDFYVFLFGEINQRLLFYNIFIDILSYEFILLILENLNLLFFLFFILFYILFKNNFILNKIIFIKKYKIKLQDVFYNFFLFLEKKIMTDRIYNKLISFMEFRNSKIYFLDYFEKGFLDTFGPKGINNLVNNLSNYFVIFTTGYIYHYIYIYLYIFFIFIIISSINIYIVLFSIISFFIIIFNIKKI